MSVNDNDPKSRATLQSINEDVFHEICLALLKTMSEDAYGKPITGKQSLNSLSSINRSMRKRLEPMVFRNIRIDIRSWHITLEALKLIAKCQAVHEHTRSLHLKIHDYAQGSLEPADGIPAAFAEALNACPKLEKLSVDVPEYESKEYKHALRRVEVRLPLVKSLELGPYALWMVSYCPNVNAISTCKDWTRSRVGLDPSKSSFDLLRAASNVSHINTLEIEEYWNVVLLEATVQQLQHLQQLSILGSVQYFKLKDFLPALRQLKQLKVLALPMADELGIGFSPPECGGPYMGENGEEVLRQVQRELRRAELRASLMVFEECPQLEVVWVDERKLSRPKPEKATQLKKIAYEVPDNLLFQVWSG